MLRASRESGQQVLDVQTLINIDVDQFYGIEIEEFPAQIAQVALWLTDHQMNMKISEEFGAYFARIPLKATPHIVCANALQTDWASVLPPERCSYVLGNPPFLGAKFMDEAQREDTRLVFNGLENSGLLDFVAAWYVKAARYMAVIASEARQSMDSETGLLCHDVPRNDGIRCAFVSTNSITQGEQVGVLWGWMLAQGIKIHFAHRTFSWSNEARGNAAVHCVIVGFGLQDVPNKSIYEYVDIKGESHAVKANDINPYLVDAPDLTLPRRSSAICDVPEIGIGNKPIDGGNYLFTTAEKEEFISKEPAAAPYFRRWVGSHEFINSCERWCLWLGDCPPDLLRCMPEVMSRVQAVRKLRLESVSASTRKLADMPTRFHVENMPASAYMIIPETSSERRLIIPIGYMDPKTLSSNAVKIISGTTVFHFGVLTSVMHMSWVRAVCGRLKNDYRYSADIVYNNFPWPVIASEARQSSEETESPNGLHRSKASRNDKLTQAIEAAAQAVLDARAAHPQASLADLYDPLTMPANLLKAHQALDKAVDAAYGYKGANTDAARVAFLFERY